MKQAHFQVSLVLALTVMLVIALTREDAAEPSELVSRPTPSAPPLLHAVPKSAVFVATLDLASKNAAALRTLVFNSQSFSGVGSLTELCGYDPSPSISTLAVAAFVAAPAASEEPAFAVLANGNFDTRKFASCAEKLVRSRGGVPVRNKAGAITLIRDVRPGSAEVALLESGLVLVSQHQYLRQMLDTLAGNAPNVTESATHQPLRAALGEQATALATLELRPGWLERLLPHEGSERSALGALQSAGLRLELTDNVIIEARLRCKTAAECTRLRRFLEDLRQQLAPELERQWGTAFPSNAAATQHGAELRLTGTISSSGIRKLLEQVSTD